MTLLHWSDDQFRLGVLALDQVHWELVQLINNLDQLPPERFGDLFAELIRHTDEHLATEARLMEEYRYPESADHRADHQWVVEKLKKLAPEVAAGRTAPARAWLREPMLEWFRRHLEEYDRPLAEHIKVQAAARGTPSRGTAPPQANRPGRRSRQ